MWNLLNLITFQTSRLQGPRRGKSCTLRPNRSTRNQGENQSVFVCSLSADIRIGVRTNSDWTSDVVQDLHGLSKFNRQFATCTGACKVRILDGQCHCQGNKRRDDITLRLADIGRWFFASFRTWIKHLRYTWTTESNESLGILTVVLRSCHGKVIYLLICSVFTIEVLKSLKQNKLALFWLCHVLALAWCCGFPPTVKHRAASLWRQHWSTLGLEGTLIIFAIRAIRSITERCHGALPLRELNM